MRFRFTLEELSGALADLGVLLPLTLGLITLNGLNASSAFVVIGLAYLVNAFAYRLPIPVQPLKSLAATALALGLPASTIAAGAWWMATLLLGLALTGAAGWLSRLFARPLVRGVQLGLALLLLTSAWTLIQPVAGPLTVGALILTGVLLAARRGEWAAIGVMTFGLAVMVSLAGWPELAPALTVPALARPTTADWLPALWLLALPQLPLSLANSVYATADAAHQYYGPRASRVTPVRLLTTMGLANAGAALLGGVPVCHGCGGLTAHYRLGARTGGAPLMLGVSFLVLGLFGSLTLQPMLQLIPYASLGVLLAYVGVQHSLLARDLRGWQDWLPALAVALVAWSTRNLALGFAAGACVYFGLRLLRRVASTGRLRLEAAHDAR